jgi:DNA-binding XRE family transcriptional regulator
MNNRTDISKYVIHSVRKPDVNDLPRTDYEFDEHDYYPLQSGEKLEDEFAVLTNIIREGGLRANLSFRNGKSTIYGNNPVVCFTEMPLINFLQYANLRGNRTRFTEYGVALLKKELYENGGRPVISGLSSTKFEYLDASKRILKPEILPLSEQYRYVKLDFSKGNDWTHEREWRIACDRKNKDFTVRDDYRFNTFETYGLNIFSDCLFSEVVIIINTEEEAKNIFQLVQDQLDSGYCQGGQEFYTKIRYLIVEKAVSFIKEQKISSIEELPESIYYTHSYETLSEIEKDKVAKALKKCCDLAPKFAEEFFHKYNLDTDDKKYNFDIAGFAFISSYHSDNKYYRYLLNEELGRAVSGSIWLNDLAKNTIHLQSITYQKYICTKQCEILNQEIENIFSVYSALD